MQQLALLPGGINSDVTACPESSEVAFLPEVGQGWEQVDDGAAFTVADMGLEEHLGDAGGRAEVAIDLEGWVGVEEVGVETASALDSANRCEEVAEDFVGVVAIQEACPEVDLPAH